jgi:uncharacterized protein YfdQ (DUF2303 family)
MSTPTDLKVVIDTAVRTVAPAVLDPGKVYAFNTPNGVQKIDLTGDDYKDNPSRKTGTVNVRDSASFIAYWDKHSSGASEVYADADALSITAVLDAHSETEPAWGSHRLHLQLRATESWKQWMAKDGKLQSQEDFAEFLEDHLAELKDPDAATMLEIAQSMQAATKVEFQSGIRLADGQRQFKFTEDTTAKAGQKGQLTIPEVFVVGLIPFDGNDGAEGYLMNARLRYRIPNGHLQIGYKLEDPRRFRDLAFAAVLKAVSEHVGRPVMNGSPA